MRYKITLYGLFLGLLFSLTGCQLTSQAQEEYDPERAALARLKLGLAYLSESSDSEMNLKAAHYNLMLADQYSPYNPNVMLGLALFNQQIGENEAADGIYQKIIQADPGNGLYLIHYGTFLCLTDHYPQAAVIFQRSIDTRASWKSDGLEQWGYCAAQHEDYDQADTLFQQLFTHYPIKRDAVRESAQFYITQGDNSLGDYLMQVADRF